MPDDLAATLPKTYAAIQQGIADGLHLGCQIAVHLNGQLLIDTAVGQVRPGEPLTPDHLLIYLSAGKPLTAVAIAQLLDRGLLNLDDPVAAYLPDFAANGKDAVTIRHCLTHTGGFRGVASRYDGVPFDQAVAAVCQARLETGWTPGQKAGYHIASSWYVLAAVVEKLTATPFSQHVREQLFLPWQMEDTWIGLPESAYNDYGHRLGTMFLTDTPEPRPHPLLDSLAYCATPKPGSNARGPARDLARFYQHLLELVTSRPAEAGLTGLTSDTTRLFTTPQRHDLFDHTFQLTVDWALGFIPNTRTPDMPRFAYGFGPHASPQTFGHGGNQSSVAFADPENLLAAAILFNGQPGEQRHAARMRAVTAALYEDLDLA